MKTHEILIEAKTFYLKNCRMRMQPIYGRLYDLTAGGDRYDRCLKYIRNAEAITGVKISDGLAYPSEVIYVLNTAITNAKRRHPKG